MRQEPLHRDRWLMFTLRSIRNATEISAIIQDFDAILHLLRKLCFNYGLTWHIVIGI